MENELQFEVATQRPYERGDVIVRVYLFNFGADPITVNSRFALNGAGLPGEVSFELVTPAGRLLPFAARVSVGEPDPEVFVTVLPWNCVGRQYELDSYYTMQRAGVYKLTANYSNDWAGTDGVDAWVGRLRSNTVEFEIGD